MKGRSDSLPSRRPSSSKAAAGLGASPAFTADSFVKSVTRSALRMQIFLLLYIHRELYLTEICHRLDKSKATVSRHLEAMRKEGVLEVREASDKRDAKRRYYRLAAADLKRMFPFSYSNQTIVEFLNPERRLEVYSKAVVIIRSLSKLFSKGFAILQPSVDAMQASLSEVERADREFAKYVEFFVPNRMIQFNPVLISKERVAMANAIYNEYQAKLEALRAEARGQNEEDSVLILHAMVPLKDILEWSARRAMAEEKK